MPVLQSLSLKCWLSSLEPITAYLHYSNSAVSFQPHVVSDLGDALMSVTVGSFLLGFGQSI